MLSGRRPEFGRGTDLIQDEVLVHVRAQDDDDDDAQDENLESPERPERPPLRGQIGFKNLQTSTEERRHVVLKWKAKRGWTSAAVVPPGVDRFVFGMHR